MDFAFSRKIEFGRLLKASAILLASACSVQASTPWAWSLDKGPADLEYHEVLGEQGLEGPFNRPSPLTWTASCSDASGNNYLFGGFDGWGVRNDLWRLAPSGNWTWLSGGGQEGEPGVYGTQGTPHADNTPGGRDGAAMWMGPDGLIYVFGGSDFDNGDRELYNDLWAFDPTTDEWTWVTGSNTTNQLATYGARFAASTTYTPGSKWDASTWVGNDGMLYLFGGVGLFENSFEVERNDLWRFNTSTKEWAWLGGGTIAEYQGEMGTQGVPHANNIPGGRWGAVTGKGTDGTLYLFGGRGFVTMGLSGINDLWSYDPDTHIWTWLKGFDEPDEPGIYGTLGQPDDANTPGTRYDAVSWTGADGSLYVYGGNGSDADGNYGDLADYWQYNPTTNRWTWLDGSDEADSIGNYGPAGTPGGFYPGGRSEGVSWTGPGGEQLLWGGRGIRESGSSGQLNDLWMRDGGDWMYIRGGSDEAIYGNYGIQGTPSIMSRPGGRYDHAAAELDGEIWVFGGHGSAETGIQEVLGDLWSYDPALQQWTWRSGSKAINPAGNNGTIEVPHADNAPGGRRNSAVWGGDDGKLYVFGGSAPGAYGSQLSNELWRFDPDTGIWTWLKGSATKNVDGTYGTQKEPAAGNTPGARFNAAAWKGADGLFYLYGGEGFGAGSEGELSDLWRYHPSSNMWEWVRGPQTNGESPFYDSPGHSSDFATPGSRQMSATAVDSDGNLYIFGGKRGFFEEHHADLFRYSPSLDQWTFLGGAQGDTSFGIYGTMGTAAAGNRPGGRLGSAMWVGPDTNVYVWGGYGEAAEQPVEWWLQTGFLGDLWSFSQTTLQWKWIAGANTADTNGALVEASPSKDNIMPGREFAAAVQLQDGTPYIIGGYGMGLGSDWWELFCDVWRAEYTASAISVTPSTSVLFGIRDMADGPTASQTITIRNDGASPASISAAFTSNPLDVFEMTSAPAASIAGGGGETTVSVRFNPLQFGTFNGTLRITTDSAEAPEFNIPLSGRATETIPPTMVVSASSPTQIGGVIGGTYVAADTGGSGLSQTAVFVRKEGGSWHASSAFISAGIWIYTPTLGAGTYYFQGVAIDHAENLSPVPTGSTGTGQATVVYNTASNAPITFPVPPGGPHVYTCPFFQSPQINVVITLTGVTTGGTLTVSRQTGNSAPPGLDPDRLIDEYLSITAGGGLTFGNANLVAQYHPTLTTAGVLPGQVNTAFRNSGGVITEFPVVLNTSNRTFTFDTPAFSDWYFGDASLSANTWMNYE